MTTIATPPDQDATARRVRRTVVVATIMLALVGSVDYIDRNSINLALPLIGSDFGIHKTQQGMLVAAFGLAYLLCQVPAGLVADRFDPRWMMLGTLVFWTVCTAVSGLAGSFAALLALRLLFGAGQGGFAPVLYKAIGQRTTPANRVTVVGTVTSVANLLTAVSPVLVAPLLAGIGWRHTFLWLAAGGGALGLLGWALLPRRLPAQVVGSPARETPSAARRAVLRSPIVWQVAVLACAINMVAYGLLTWAPSYLHDTKGVPLAQTGNLVAIPALASVLATLAGGWLYDRYFHHHSRWYLVVTIGIGAVMLAAMVTATTAVLFTLYATLAMVGLGLATMCVIGLPLRALPTAVLGLTMSILNIGAYLPTVLAPTVMGWLVDHVSYTAAFILVVACGVASVVLSLFLPNSSDAADPAERETA